MSASGHPRRELVRTDDAPTTAPYSPAVAYGELVWTSGALPTEADGAVPAEFAGQVRAALANLGTSLRMAGADWSTVIKITGYIADIEHLPVLNEIYAETVLPHGAPARTTVQVAGFRGSFLIEFESVAHRLPR